MFLKRVTEAEQRASIELKPPPQPPSSPPNTQFRISFYLHRISTPETQHANSQIKPSLAFLLLKPILKTTTASSQLFTFQYVVSIESDGFLTLKKIQTIDSASLDQPPVSSSMRPGSGGGGGLVGLNYKLLWTLKNERVNLNDANASYAAEISIKLTEPNLVEMAVNRTYVARFELVNEFVNEMWEIDSVKFRNFNQFVYPPVTTSTSLNHGFFFNLPPTPAYYQNGFLLYDLQINGVFYVLRASKPPSLVELVLLDERLEFMEAFESTVNSLALFNRTVHDFDVIDALNQNENYCDGSSVAQTSYDLGGSGNRNRANYSTTIRNR